jgi:hypothetical protein
MSVLLAAGLVGTAGLSACQREQPRALPSDTAPVSTTAVASPAPGRDHFCRVGLPGSWQTALTGGAIPHAADEMLVVKAVSADGSSVFADSRQGGVRELVWLHRGQRTVVTRLPDTDHEVFGAAFDGRWLAFSVWDEPVLESPWTMYAWDSQAGGVPRQLGRTEVGGEPYPLVYNGHAFWTLSVAEQRSEVHMTDLAKGQDRVLDTGRDDYPFRYGSLIVWTQRTASAVQLKAASITTGEPAALPVELQEPLSVPLFVNGDGDTYVWVGDNLFTLRVWRTGSTDALTVVKADALGEYLQWPQVGGPLVTWDNGSAQFVADLRSGSYAQLTPWAGATLLSGDALVVTYAPASKGTVVDSTLIRPSQLPALPTCP